MKKMLFGIVIGLILGIGITAFADTQMIQVAYSNIRLVINGKTIDTGNDIPFNFNGRIYVPARYIAEGLGATVNWESNSNTINVTGGENMSQTLKPQKIQTEQKDGFTLYVMDGIEYLSSIEFNKKYYHDKNDNGYILTYNNGISALQKYDSRTFVMILDNIPMDTIGKIINGRSCIEYQYFQDTILPLLK